MPADAALTALESNARRGLDAAVAKSRLANYGLNRLPPAGRRGPLLRLLAQFHNTLIYVLLAAGSIKLLLGGYTDASVIFGVVIINSLLGFIQEGKAEKALDSIREMLSPEAMAVRDGSTRMIPAAELVPGDVVLLQSGDKVPADLRLLETHNLRIEEAALTGESLPVEKHSAPVEATAQLGDRAGSAYSGTLVISGRARGVVVATGSDTEIGRINAMLTGVKELETPLLRQIHHFGKTLTVVILAVTLLVVAYGWLLRSHPLDEMFRAAVGIAVAAIPEGLPAVVTITLAIGVRRMARRNAIIRRLPAVETLGSVSRICSDKTGTLTRNEMTVTRAVTSAGNYEVTGEGYRPDGAILLDREPAPPSPLLDAMALVSILCNESHLVHEQGRWALAGDPTEGALLPFAAKTGIDREALAATHPRRLLLPFESEHKFMATLNDSEHGPLLCLKGAPDVVLDFCDRQAAPDGSPQDIDHRFWEQQNEQIAAGGRRVLALAWLPGARVQAPDFTPGGIPRNLILLGLTGIMDPPREEAVEAVKLCHQGGIRVTMITGDHAATATGIARMLGIGDGSSSLTGREIDTMDDDALAAACRKVDVFARTSPEHKLRLVRAIQASGAVVAMTGDGVNDAPALKQADVGVAMGIKGTEVSRESAEMVLADDNFASITAAVREGRTVFNNIEKAILFMLPTNGGQGLTILAAVMLGLTMPATPPQILWVNMVVSITLALAISFEPHENGVMSRPPRRVDRPLLDHFGLWRIAFISLLLLLITFGAFFLTYRMLGRPLEIARTTAVNALIIGQIAYLLNSRYLKESSLTLRALAGAGNHWIPVSILAVLALQFVFTYTPFMQDIFGTAAIPALYWACLLPAGLLMFLIVELEKYLLRRQMISTVFTIPITSVNRSGRGWRWHRPSRAQVPSGASTSGRT
jgi:magnesium-transporting ATPase (P-type)